MANPGSGGRKGCRPASGFKPTIDRLERDWQHEDRFRLQLLSILLVLILVLILVLSTHLILPRVLPHNEQRDDSDHSPDWFSWVVCGALLVFMAWIWGEVRRRGLRIAEQQNICYHIQFLADRCADGFEVTEREWQVFEEVTRLLKAVSRLQNDEPLHPLLALLGKISRLDKGTQVRDTAIYPPAVPLTDKPA